MRIDGWRRSETVGHKQDAQLSEAPTHLDQRSMSESVINQLNWLFVLFYFFPHWKRSKRVFWKNASHLRLDWLGAVFVRIFDRERAGLPRDRRDDPGSDPRGRDSTWDRSRARSRLPQVQQGNKEGWRKYSALISDSSRNSNTTEYKYSVFSALRVKKKHQK